MKTLDRPRDAAEIVERLRRVRPDSARRWGRMSVHQMVCHLSDAFRMAMGAKRVSHATDIRLRAVVKCIALYVPVRWPPGIVTRPEVDQEAGGTSPGEFAEDLSEVERLLMELIAQPRDFVWPTHPIFGPMSRAAWMRWGYLHTDHHLRQFGA